MKPLSLQRRRGFTRTELVVVIVVIAVLLSMFLPSTIKVKGKAQRIDCVNNLKEIGVANLIWAGDHGDAVPKSKLMPSGGLAALFAGTNAGTNCWAYYAVLQEFGESPKILLCPADERKAAAYFAKGGATNAAGTGVFKDNTTVSYFFSPDANDVFPQSIAFGDRNLGPGTVPHDDYGFSPANGQGNDVVINGPVCWSLKMHSAGNTAGAGNILLGDGSAQQITSASFNKFWLTNAMTASTNHHGIRLVFP